MKSRIPPHNIEAERSVLGAILLDNDALMKIAGIIGYQDFYEPKHQKIFNVICGMIKFAIPIDLVNLSERLLMTGNLEMIGGAPYIMDLMESTPTATTIVHHAKIVKEKSNLRKLIAISTQINLEAYGEQVEVEKLLISAEKNLYDIRENIEKNNSDWEKLGDTLPALCEDIQAICEPSENIEERMGHPIPTGFHSLDEMIVGLSESNMVVLAARPSMGKTAFSFTIARNIAMSGIPVAIFSIETARKQAALRFLCTEAKVDSHLIRLGNLGSPEWEKLYHGVSVLDGIPLYICDCPGLTLQDLRFKAKIIVKKQNVKVIIIDYLQLMKIPGMRGKRTEEVSELSAGIKAIGRELGVCMMPLSQLSREVEKRKPPRPILSDLRESGAIEQDADIVIFLYRHAYYVKKVTEFGGEDFTTEVIVVKNRNGRIGTAKMIFIPKYTRFEEKEYYD
jgi:replicative DNA helicase